MTLSSSSSSYDILPSHMTMTITCDISNISSYSKLSSKKEIRKLNYKRKEKLQKTRKIENN